MNRLFEPDPRTYRHLLDRLEREVTLKLTDHTTHRGFTLKPAPGSPPAPEQEKLFLLPEILPAPQAESLFSVDPTA